MDINTIDQILETYQLTDYMYQKLRTKASKVLIGLHDSEFDAAYRYIDSIAFTKQSGKETHTNPLRVDNLDVLLIGQERFLDTSNADITYDNKISNLNEISIKNILGVLEKEFEDIEFDIFNQLLVSLDQNVESLPINLNKIVENKDQVQSALMKIAEKYTQCGKIIIPSRPISSISFTPLNIIYQRRNFNGNPLLVYNEIKLKHGPLKRSQLRKIDPGLYQALRRHNQLDLAIPERFIATTFGDPLKYFNENGYQGMSRYKLKIKNPSLYNAILKKKQMDKAIPEKKGASVYRGYSSPLECYNANKSEFEGMNRTQVKKKDSGLIAALHRWNQIDEAIPKKTT